MLPESTACLKSYKKGAVLVYSLGISFYISAYENQVTFQDFIFAENIGDI